MCYRIDSEIIIANFFAECDKINELKLSSLYDIKCKIEDEFKKDGQFLFIDVSRESINNAVYSNSKYFTFTESGAAIKFIPSRINVFYEDVYGVFNSRINQKIKYKLLKILEDVFENQASKILVGN